MPGPKWTLQIAWPEQRWWSDPELVITAFATAMPYAVAVELRRDEEGVWFASGVAVRRHMWADGWRGERANVSPREMQRLPIATIVRAALAAAATSTPPEPAEREPQPVPGHPGWTSEPLLAPGEVVYDPGDAAAWSESAPEWANVARAKLRVPRGRPQRGRSAGFYKKIGDLHREIAKAGGSPAKEIARRMGESENTIHQWIHRARALDYLEPSARKKPAG